MMCSCDEAIGRRHLAHQLNNGTELKTRARVPVTLGFQQCVCPECRGEPPVHAPAAAIHGRTSKIKRFYWREIGFDQMERMADWEAAHPEASDQERAAAYHEAEKLALEHIKALHATKPKYDFAEPSQAEILRQHGVEIVALHVEHAANAEKGLVIVKDGQTISPEAYVAQHYQAAGWSVLPLESRPLHALFGVMMWMLIQDPGDPFGQMSGFGRRDVFEAGGEPDMIWTSLPEDFGAEGYASRQQRAMKKHFKVLSDGQDDLLWLFDLWVPGSEHLRQYLWAHRDEDLQRARKLVEILPSETIIRILRYLIGWYWERYLGWPDLLAYRGDELLLLEVKSSSDKLSDDQKRWIGDNADLLKLPFKVVKLHRKRA